MYMEVNLLLHREQCKDKAKTSQQENIIVVKKSINGIIVHENEYSSLVIKSKELNEENNSLVKNNELYKDYKLLELEYNNLREQINLKTRSYAKQYESKLKINRS